MAGENGRPLDCRCATCVDQALHAASVVVVSPGRSMSLPFSKRAPARTSATDREGRAVVGLDRHAPVGVDICRRPEVTNERSVDGTDVAFPVVDKPR